MADCMNSAMGCIFLCGKHMKQRKLIIATALFSASVLTACGGGGDSGSGGGPEVDTSVLTIEGTAVKGPISNAKISVYRTNGDGTKGELLNVNGTTSGADGTYSVTVKGYSGIVLVEAEAIPGTLMADEATGKSFEPVTGFKMRASFFTASGVTNIAQINPFTELATATALAKPGGLNDVNVGQSNKDMRALLRFDPLTTPAEFSLNGAPKNLAALALATVSKMAQSGDLDCSSVIGQAARVDCVVRKMSTMATDYPGLKEVIERRGSEISDEVPELPPLVLSVPTGTPVSSATPRELTNAFIGALRKNAKALKVDDMTLQTELEASVDDFKGRTAAITSSNLDVLNVAHMGVQFWTDVVRNDSALFEPRKDFYKGHEYLGDCRFYRDSNYSVAATSKVDAKFLDCGTAPQFLPATDTNGMYKSCNAVGDLCSTAWSVRVRLHPDVANPDKFTIYTQTRKAQYKLATQYSYLSSPLGKTISSPSCPTGESCTTVVVQYEDSSNRTHYGAAFPGNAATLLAMQRDIDGKVTSVNLTGDLSPAFHMAQSAYFTNFSPRSVVKPNEEEQVVGYKQNVTLTAALSKVGGLEKLAVSGLMDLIKNGVQETRETRIELEEGSYLQVKTDVAGNAEDGSEEKLFKLKAGKVGGTVEGDLKISAFKFDASRNSYIPTLISFSGSVQRGGQRFFKGTLTGEVLNHARFDVLLPRSSNNFQAKRFSFEGEVTILNRPVLKVSLSGTRKDTGNSANDTTQLSGQYVQDGITMNVSGFSSGLLDVVTLESTDGIKLVIDRSKTNYPLTRGADSMGLYSTTDKKVTYADGSSEQF